MRSIRRRQARAGAPSSHWRRTLRHGLWYVPLVHLGLPLLGGWPRGPRFRVARWLRRVGRTISVLGGGLTAWSVWTMVRHGDGTPAPHDPPRRLICAGPYCRVRNPMELGNLLALAGRALAAGCPRLASASLLFGIGTHVWVVLIEEPYLQRHFGSAYQVYCQRVPRWGWRINRSSTMNRVSAQQAATLAATPEQIYAVIADYRHHHPEVLPKPYFNNLEVEEGGFGAGTVFRATMKVFGVDRAFRMRVTEPEPGRTLVESDLGTDLVTTFSIIPTADPGQTQLKIETNWGAKPGLGGWLERTTTPAIMRMIYRKELRILAAYLKRPTSPSSNAQG